MKELALKRLTNLFTVKSIVTITLTITFCVLECCGSLSQDYMTIYTAVIGFYFGTQPATFGAKLQNAWYSALDFVRMVWRGLGDLLAGAVGVKDLSGPVGIVSMMSEVGKESATKAAAFSNLAYFSAFIAVNLAVMNMLPLPALDGGRVFCLLVTWVLERLTRKKIDPKYEGYIHTAGLVLLLALMAYVMYNDISKLVT